MRFNEKNLPALRYVAWHRPLREHPDFVKGRRASSNEILGARGIMQMAEGMRTAQPFCFPSVGYCRSVSSLSSANDAAFGIGRVWPELAECASRNIEVLSSTFAKALDSAYETLLTVPLFREMEGETMSGMLVFPDGVTYIYDFEITDVREADIGGKTIGYKTVGNAVVLENGRDLVYDYFEDVDTDGNAKGTYSWHNFRNGRFFYDNGSTNEDTIGGMLRKCGFDQEMYREYPDDEIMGVFELITVLHLFKRYAPVDVYETHGGKGSRPPKNLEIVDTPKRVHILDSSWYTTIIHTGDFSVKGHLRLQPYGPGRSQKKLIYIHEFLKHGYVRRAKLFNYAEERCGETAAAGQSPSSSA